MPGVAGVTPYWHAGSSARALLQVSDTSSLRPYILLAEDLKLAYAYTAEHLTYV